MNKKQRTLEALGQGLIIWGVTTIASVGRATGLALGAIVVGFLTIWLA